MHSRTPIQHWESRKTMSKSNSIGITTLRQKLRKYIKDNHEDEIKIYKEVRFE